MLLSSQPPQTLELESQDFLREQENYVSDILSLEMKRGTLFIIPCPP